MLYEGSIAPQEFHDDYERHDNACRQVELRKFLLIELGKIRQDALTWWPICKNTKY
jgi:hypothetical protein